MNKSDFDAWYRKNIHTMAKLGVLHPDSSAGRTVHLAVASLQPQIAEIQSRLNNIENLLYSMKNIPDDVRQEFSTPLKSLKDLTVEIEDDMVPKVVETVVSQVENQKQKRTPPPPKPVEETQKVINTQEKPKKKAEKPSTTKPRKQPAPKKKKPSAWQISQ